MSVNIVPTAPRFLMAMVEAAATPQIGRVGVAKIQADRINILGGLRCHEVAG
jgi:hypothetical protein